DIRGRKISGEKVNNTSVQIALHDLESAIYFVTITTERGSITKRVIKNSYVKNNLIESALINQGAFFN
ncbi:MAG: T9SS type A sorting domain-containing protein, partial [Bacteroidetes bacterium]|nr:T9SS type A sorting domain-containing protein [Bacteroidota bacterium]